LIYAILGDLNCIHFIFQPCLWIIRLLYSSFSFMPLASHTKTCKTCTHDYTEYETIIVGVLEALAYMKKLRLSLVLGLFSGVVVGTSNAQNFNTPPLERQTISHLTRREDVNDLSLYIADITDTNLVMEGEYGSDTDSSFGLGIDNTSILDTVNEPNIPSLVNPLSSPSSFENIPYYNISHGEVQTPLPSPSQGIPEPNSLGLGLLGALIALVSKKWRQK
jgi:hypothetical protein